MNVLILGSGGRAHTFAKKIFESPQKPNVFVAPGNAGTSAFANNIPLICKFYFCIFVPI